MLTPVRVLDLEISQPLAGIGPAARPGEDAGERTYSSALVLVRLHGRPLGTLQLDLRAGTIAAGDVARQVWERLRQPIVDHLAADGLEPPVRLTETGLTPEGPPGDPQHKPACQRHDESHFPFASVVISTHERPGPVGACIESILRADYPAFEVLVVDNAPRTAATREMVAERFADDLRVRYLLEPTPGASAGRNCGLRAASGEVVAFVDDDVLVDRLWLRSLVLGFQAAPGVACVTGMILPAELDTQSQVWIEEFGGFDKGYEQRIFDLGEHAPADPLYPYSVGKFGSGASAAFDPVVLREIGGFDTALGPATPACGGEDIDAFLQIILAGYRLVYEPRSLVRHHHRREYADLRRAVRGYGVGLAAVLTKALLNPKTRADVLRRAPRGVAYFLNPSSPKNEKKTSTFPRQLTLVEMGGALVGPVAYLRSRRWARTAGRTATRAS
ncbi:MAG TPA: glycosyltransferase [Actinomycetota bacterium]|jgi:glycosyltransferase involved in cell wall biosynthesis